MKKHLQLIKLTIMETIEYRGKIIIWFLAGSIAPLIALAIWLSSMGDQAYANGISKSYIITYYGLILICGQLFFPHVVRETERRIQDGSLNIFLTRPLTLPKYTITHESTWKVLETLFALPFLIIFFVAFKDYIVVEQTNSLLILLALALFTTGYLINLLYDFCIGSLAFWIFKTSSITRTSDLIFSLTSGRIIPLMFLPSFLQKIVNFLPFKYTLYLPINILMGQMTKEEILTSALIQLSWLIFMLMLRKFIWSKGIRKYEGVGI
ncbi:ABC-2 family transporter protein [Candidatus Dojkabacteria bacterium]|nr:ABC-2 family transporter protein [Candidatus Dojkabacteria bacterium]